MNVLLVDDELNGVFYETYKVVTKIIEKEGGRVFDSLNATQALNALEEQEADNMAVGDIIDVAIIDFNLGENSIKGDLLGEEIAQKYPHIASIILTGDGSIETKYIRCQSVMRKGFCDFRDKADFKAEDIAKTIKTIFELPSVQAKQKLKKRAYIAEQSLSEKEKAIQIVNEEDIKDDEDLTEDNMKSKVLNSLLYLLDNQEKTFKVLNSFEVKFHELTKDAIGRATVLFMDNKWDYFVHEFASKEEPNLSPKDAEKTIFSYLRVKEYEPFIQYKDSKKSKKQEVEYSLAKVTRIDSRIGGHFRVHHESGLYEKEARYVRRLLLLYPERWKHTLIQARKNATKKKPAIPTFIDEIVKHFNL
jgi:FixJ family two-component response regulator